MSVRYFPRKICPLAIYVYVCLCVCVPCVISAEAKHTTLFLDISIKIEMNSFANQKKYTRDAHLNKSTYYVITLCL